MSKAPLMAVEAAIEELLRLAEQAPFDAIETLPLAQGLGRVLARSLSAQIDSPPWDNSAMDGYALRLADWSGGALPVSRRVLAGQAPGVLEAGTCIRIFTGAPIPQGADCVVLQEDCEVSADGRVLPRSPLRAGMNIRLRGEEIRQGAPLFAAGKRLGPAELGVLAAQGYASVPLVHRPRVALFTSGDELVEAGAPLAPGQIYNANRTLLAAALQRLGCEVLDLGNVADDPEQLHALLDALPPVELILSSGGVSVGDADFIGALLKAEGQVRLWKLAIKPGKPFTFAHFKGTPFIGLPGNPGSALVTFALLARPYLLRRMGVPHTAPLHLPVRAGFDWPRAGNRQEYLRVSLVEGEARLYANQSSGVLLSAACTDGLLEVLPGLAFQRGTLLNFIPFTALF
ncbi:molybdopterin molybdotransferase MoeA [Pseudomonas knackmussii]|uniref:molybdopterin molybdotransferase MoeA n=1 Tax=Pseudomonas knackmussii TaxID=65741 RepID=UPI003F4A0869